MFSSPAVAALLRDLHTVSGCRVSLHDCDFREIAACPESVSGFCSLVQQNPKAGLHCVFTDRDAFERVRHSGKIYLYKCRFGLWEAACPLYRNGVLVGYLMMGQAKEKGPASDNPLAAALPYLEGSLREKAGDALEALPALSQAEATAFSHIMTLCAEHLASLASGRPFPAADLPEAVIRYINRNLGKKLAIGDLCAAFRCSKSTLMKSFRDGTGMTVGEYVVSRRIDLAKELLQYTEDPIGMIAAACGFPDPAYFSKVFSARTGRPPSAFRRDPFGKKGGLR